MFEENMFPLYFLSVFKRVGDRPAAGSESEACWCVPVVDYLVSLWTCPHGLPALHRFVAGLINSLCPRAARSREKICSTFMSFAEATQMNKGICVERRSPHVRVLEFLQRRMFRRSILFLLFLLLHKSVGDGQPFPSHHQHRVLFLVCFFIDFVIVNIRMGNFRKNVRLVGCLLR